MNTVPLELILLQLGEPPYSDAKISELLAWATSRELPCSAAELKRLEQLAGTIAAGTALARL